MKHMTTGKRLAVVALALTIALLVGVGVSMGTGNEPSTVHELTPKPATAAIPEGLRNAFSVLKAGSATQDAPATIKSRIASDPMLKSYGGNAELAVSAPAGDAGTVYIVPGEDAVCIYASDPRDHHLGGSCASAEDAAAGKLTMWFTDESGKNVDVVALVPDTDKVSVTTSDGKTSSISVANNVAAFHRADPDSMTVGSMKQDF